MQYATCTFNGQCIKFLISLFSLDIFFFISAVNFINHCSLAKIFLTLIILFFSPKLLHTRSCTKDFTTHTHFLCFMYNISSCVLLYIYYCLLSVCMSVKVAIWQFKKLVKPTIRILIAVHEVRKVSTKQNVHVNIYKKKNITYCWYFMY